MSALPSGVRDRRSLRRALEEFVHGFGTTPDGVADSLTEAGVRGTPGDVTGCAIARYMQVVVGAEPSVSEVMVSEHKLRVTRKWGRFPITVNLPRAVTAFVREFDAGSYPQLVDPTAAAALRGGPGCGADPAELAELAELADLAGPTELPGPTAAPAPAELTEPVGPAEADVEGRAAEP